LVEERELPLTLSVVKWRGGDRPDPDELGRENVAVNSIHGISCGSFGGRGEFSSVVASVFHSDGVVCSVPVLDEDV